MKIFIKTYLYNLSDFIPHLVEHCVSGKTKIDSDIYFNYKNNTKLTTFLDYTIFEIPNYFDIELFINKITDKIDKKLIKIEKAVIKDELSKFNYEIKLFETIAKKLYGKKFNITKVGKYSIQEIMNYHDKYYKLDNMIICDDDYNIVKDSYIYRRNKKVEFSFDSLKLSITLNGYKNYALIRKYKTWRDYYMFFFLRELLDAYFSFKYRYVKHRYYYDLETFFFRTEELNILVVSGGFDIDFDLEFFEKFKETFYNIISFDYRKKGIVINKLLTGDIIKLEEVINYIKSIDYKNVLDLLGRKRDYKAR